MSLDLKQSGVHKICKAVFACSRKAILGLLHHSAPPIATNRQPKDIQPVTIALQKARRLSLLIPSLALLAVLIVGQKLPADDDEGQPSAMTKAQQSVSAKTGKAIVEPHFWGII